MITRCAAIIGCAHSRSSRCRHRCCANAFVRRLGAACSHLNTGCVLHCAPRHFCCLRVAMRSTPFCIGWRTARISFRIIVALHRCFNGISAFEHLLRFSPACICRQAPAVLHARDVINVCSVCAHLAYRTTGHLVPVLLVRHFAAVSILRLRCCADSACVGVCDACGTRTFITCRRFAFVPNAVPILRVCFAGTVGLLSVAVPYRCGRISTRLSTICSVFARRCCLEHCAWVCTHGVTAVPFGARALRSFYGARYVSTFLRAQCGLERCCFYRSIHLRNTTTVSRLQRPLTTRYGRLDTYERVPRPLLCTTFCVR